MLLADATSAVEQSTMQVVRETVLGGIAVGAIALAVWAVLTLKKVQDARVADKDAQADRAEKSNEKDRDRSEKHTTAIQDLAVAVRENTRAVEAQKQVLESMKTTISSLFEWLKLGLGKSSSSMPAVRPRREGD
jgi:hypothetical protein